ncbi:MAG: 3-hydroxyacyl-ACP dehydratase FabZ [Gammaproteobacteria bacterium]|nr:3-hydroxyacyl-ACP dehydratase FabZ [Gammaproteobacteria bacterium]
MKDITEILDLLPHRYPFLLVDRVEEIVAGERARGFKNVTINEDFFNGHFPDNPVMPGVLIIEALAQLSGVLAFVTNNRQATDGYIYFLAGIDRSRFRRPVVPGDRLMLESTSTADRLGLLKFHTEASVDDELVCTSDITIMERKV